MSVTTTTQTRDASRNPPIEEHFGPMADNLSRLWGARIGVPRAETFTPIPVLGRLPGMLRL
jgi:hypothetical protein